MRNSSLPWSLTVLTTVALAAPCLAVEQGVTKARLALNDVAARVRGLQKGDVRNANKLIAKISRAVEALKACKDKGAKEWQAQAKRVKELDAKVRARLGSVQPPPKTDGTPQKPDAATRRAKEHADRAEKLLAKQSPGDVAAANRTIAAANDARRQLGATRLRSTALWKETLARADRVIKKARALAVQKGSAKPVGPEPGQPGSDTLPVRPRVEPVEGRLYYERSLTRPEQTRNERTKALVPEIEALAAAGKREEAKLKFWGVWAQSKRARYYGDDKADQRSLDLYQRAREAIYGSSPVLGAKDGPVELLTLIRGADVALGAGDLESARIVLDHVRWRFQRGVSKEGKLGEAATQLLATFKERNEAFAKAVTSPLNTLADTIPLDREGCTFEEQHAKLRAGQMRIQGKWLLGFRKNRRKLEAAARAFVKVAPDPEYIDRAFATICKTKKGASTWKRFTGALRMVVYGRALLDAEGQLEREALSQLRLGEGKRKSAEFSYQKGKSKSGDNLLAQARAHAKQAELLEAPARDVAALRARIDAAKAAGAANKLQEAEKKIAAALKYAKAGKEYQLRNASSTLASAKSWIEAAKKDGVDTTGAQVKLDSAWAVFARHWATLAEAKLKQAEDKLDDAAAKLKDGARAWAVPKRLAAALSLQEYCGAEYIPRSGGKKAGLERRAAAIVARAKTMQGKATAAQRVPDDAYAGSSGSSWRSRFKSLLKSQRGWTVLELSITSKDWKDKTASYEYLSGSNTKTIETRWYRHLFVWAAIPNAENPDLIDLRYLGFRLHKMTDGSYRKLKLYYVDEPVPMLRKNLK